MISKYLKNTHASTHNQYDTELLDVFALEHEKKDFTDVGNRWVACWGQSLWEKEKCPLNSKARLLLQQPLWLLLDDE